MIVRASTPLQIKSEAKQYLVVPYILTIYSKKSNILKRFCIYPVNNNEEIFTFDSLIYIIENHFKAIFLNITLI